jgi:multidrug efflux system membrane fusion protein
MKKSFFIALIIAVIAVLWVGSGMLQKKKSAEKLPEPDQQTLSEEDAIIEVRVEDMTAQNMIDTAEVTGRTQASRRVSLKAETQGQISQLLVKKGDRVKAGQILARIEAQDRQSRVNEAQQLLNQRDIQYKAAKELAAKGFTSQIRLAQARAELETARTQLKQARVELSNIIVKAPFDGIIDAQMVELGDFASQGTEIFDVVDLAPIEIVGFLTEKLITHVNEGDEAAATLLGGKKVMGQITFVSPTANQQTRTFEIEVTVANDDLAIKEGLTAKILIPVKEAKAYKISPSILSLSDDGTTGVKIVNQDNQVEFMPITLLKDTPTHLWIGGLPDKVRMITVGQEFVVQGQIVKPVLMNKGSNAP